MRKPRTSFVGWTDEQIRAHHNAAERRRRLENPEQSRKWSRDAYARNSKKIIARQAEAFAANPEVRRKTVRDSRHRKPWKYVLRAAADRAKKKGLLFTLTDDWGLANYTGRCALTGIEFVVGRSEKHHGPNPYSPSLDQIVAGAGYTPENCRYVLHAVNMFKSTMPDAEMFTITRALLGMR